METLISYLQCWWREKEVYFEKEKIEPKKKIFSEDFNSFDISNINCSNCFCNINKNTLIKKAQINKSLFGFCSENCYNTWLKCPNTMLIGKIN